MISVVSVDLNRVSGMIMTLMMWMTPVIYSDRVSHPVVQLINRWNPMTYLVCSARDIVLYGRLYDPPGYVACAFLSLLVFLLSWRLFYVAENRLIERMV
jgi:lipopolysaccharide transport system permease protein